MCVDSELGPDPGKSGGFLQIQETPKLSVLPSDTGELSLPYSEKRKGQIEFY